MGLRPILYFMLNGAGVTVNLLGIDIGLLWRDRDD